ncbi:nucleoside-diphosphate sugar epimerase/dehydratase [Jeotgalibacillus haloalkalitolerans]|uniref:Nucleoside-diphosphate sugar epimerase/dehydratase n=1 Tax=Jeotgalibacillus haloalkalitolerans TaxID=3104292 RepID=A0ABU5KI41_9BACL|nr:nucleoside-diphosphate sugar epimerase/dehydratase [Jeotgalibacillus sp. HH7-29]MDZ5710900.1 nucleoside-diphosphate sugar epimerase/dehydratase [Jeotgalibacillus sp. HH7-29]
MSYKKQLSIFIVLDLFLVFSAFVLSHLLVNGLFAITHTFMISSAVLLGMYLGFSSSYRLYKKAWEYASVIELLIILKATALSVMAALFVETMITGQLMLRVMIVTWLLQVLMVGGSRFVWRIYRNQKQQYRPDYKRTLIIGAGAAGTMVARQLLQGKDCDLKPVAFIDDNPHKHNLDVLGLPVYGGTGRVVEAVEKLKIQKIIIAIPSLNKKQLNKIYTECAKSNTDTKILPMIEDLISGKVSVSQMREVQVEDLLGRKPVELDLELLSGTLKNKIILVTGAGGSIGSEICRQLIKFQPSKMILLGHGENSIYNIEMELRLEHDVAHTEFITEIADVQDAQKMMEIMYEYKPDIVYHAAAHKHVPLMERNPEEAVKNNIIGTRNVAQASSWNGVDTFVMISTDKAVNPTNVMGASKKLAEMIVQGMDQISNTKFVAVRFGNVLGSRGSVIPHFKKQIERGGPVTVTHPEMIRYFMTIPEASRLVIQAGALAEGGEIFVLDMGEPVRIVDLAKNMITLSGNSLEDIDIVFTGIRPGEKLYEELLNQDEVRSEQIYPKIYIGQRAELYLDEIESIIDNFSLMEKENLKQKLLELANRKPAHLKKSNWPISS